MPSSHSLREPVSPCVRAPCVCTYEKLRAAARPAVAAVLLALTSIAPATLKQSLPTHATPAALEQPPSPTQYIRDKIEAIFAENEHPQILKTPHVLRPGRKKPFRPKTKVVPPPLSEWEIRDIVVEESNKVGFDEDLALALGKTESGFDPDALSGKGAKGVMQLMPDKAEELGVENPLDARQNIRGGIEHFKYLIKKYGSKKKALIAYNCGEGALQKYLRTGKLPKGAADYLRKFLEAEADIRLNS